MIIEAFPSGPFATNAYIVACPETSKAAVVDPAPGSSAQLNAFLSSKNLTLDKILLTHSHWDHIADVSLLKEKYGVPVYVHPLDKQNLEEPGSDNIPCWIDIQGVKADHAFADGESLTIGNIPCTVIHTPGHSPGGVCFYFKEQKVLISGDTLFKGTIGNLSIPTGRPNLMWDALAKLARLPPDTVVYPGHGGSTTIGAERWLAHAKQVFGGV